MAPLSSISLPYGWTGEKVGQRWWRWKTMTATTIMMMKFNFSTLRFAPPLRIATLMMIATRWRQCWSTIWKWRRSWFPHWLEKVRNSEAQSLPRKPRGVVWLSWNLGKYTFCRPDFKMSQFRRKLNSQRGSSRVRFKAGKNLLILTLWKEVMVESKPFGIFIPVAFSASAISRQGLLNFLETHKLFTTRVSTRLAFNST